MRSKPARRTTAALILAVTIAAPLTSAPPTTAAAGELGTTLLAPFGLDVSRADIAAAWGDNLLIDFGWYYRWSNDNGRTSRPTTADHAGELTSVDSGKAVLTTDDWVEVFDLTTNQISFHWMPPGVSAKSADARTAVVTDGQAGHPFSALDLATAARVPLHSEHLAPLAAATDSEERVSVFAGAALDLVDHLDASGAKIATDIDVMPLDGSDGQHPVRVDGLVAYAAIRGDQVEVVKRAGAEVSLCSWPVAAAQGSAECHTIATLADPSQPVWADRSGDMILLDIDAGEYLWVDGSLKKVTHDGTDAVFEGRGRPTRPLIRVDNGTHDAIHQVQANGTSTLLFSDPAQPVPPTSLDLAADQMVGISVNLAWTEAYGWSRRVTPDAIEDEKRIAGDGYIRASAGRVVTGDTSGLTFYDRGRVAGTGPVVPGLLAESGPYVLVRPSYQWQPRTIRTSAGLVAATNPLAIFGSRYVGRGQDVKGRPQAFVKDLANPSGPTFTFSPPPVSGEWASVATGLWGDWVSLSIWTGTEEDLYFLNYVTGAPPTIFRNGRLLEMGDGVALILGGTGNDGLFLWNYVTGERTSVPNREISLGLPASIDDGNRVAFTQANGVAVATVPGMGLSAPRLLGTVAPASFKPYAGPWTPEFDATKPLSSGTLEISHETDLGTVVDRVLDVPASSDGSIRDVSWDGKDEGGNLVADGRYTWTLKLADAADSGKALFAIDGVSPASGTVVVNAADGTPVISDTSPVVDQTLTARPDTGGPGSEVAFSWYRGTTAIAGATTDTYTVQPGDAGKELKVKVTVTKPGSSVASTKSARTKKVQRAAFTTVTDPVVTGSIKAGMVLSAAGDTTPSATKTSFQWYRGSKRIAGATRSQYQTTSADVGAHLKVRATYLRSGYGSITRYSAAGEAIERGLQPITPKLADTTPMVGQVLRITPTSDIGAWSHASATPAYQWYRGSTAISGATGATYEVQAADLGRSLKVRVTGTRDSYAPVSRTSAASSKVVKGLFTVRSVTIAGLVNGTTSVGQTLRADTDGWSPSPTSFTYAWNRAGAPIPGATGATYEVVEADRGAAITVAVVASRDGFVTASATSSAVIPD